MNTKTIKTNIEWLSKLLPEGFPIRTSTIITGPGGSGKPLIGESIASSWLIEGGSIAFISLQYPSTDFIMESIKEVTGLNLDDYQDNILFFKLDINEPNLVEEKENVIRGNLIKPENWDMILNISKAKLPSDGPGILIFASALNLLLFSPTYGNAVLDKIRKIMKENNLFTYLFSVSTNVKKEEISILEDAADNLLMSRSDKKPFRLFVEIIRMSKVPYLHGEIQVPIKPESLNHIKGIAEHSRKKIIPEISKI